MPNAEIAASPETEDNDEGISVEDECRVLYSEVEDAEQRLVRLAAEASPAEAKVYREVAGTVLTLVKDSIALMGEGFAEALSAIERLEDGEPVESVLLGEDGKLYVAYLEQMENFLRQLAETITEGPTVEAIAALRRMTADRLEFTKSIMVEGGDGDDGPADPDDEDE